MSGAGDEQTIGRGYDGNNHMATDFGDIDGPTTRFLARIAKDINFLHRDCSTSPTNERFFREGVNTYEVGQLEVDGEIITIYSFNAGRVFNTLQQQTSGTSSKKEVEQFFAADWPVKEETGQSYITFYFKTRPSKSEIKKAHAIHQVKIAIENREVIQEFRCENCSERVHWTNLKNDEEMSLEERIILLEKQLCNCEGSLSLLRKGLAENEPASASSVSGSSGKPTAPPMD